MIKLWITNLGKYNEGYLVSEILNVPFGEGELEEVLEDIGINQEYEEFFISDYESELNINISEYANLEDLNYNIDYIQSLTDDIGLINGIIDHYTDDLNDIIQILRDGNYSILDGTRTVEHIGIALAEEIYLVDTSTYISSFIDYRRLGEESEYNLIDGDRALEVF